MQAIRQIIDIQKLNGLIAIPEGFSIGKVEIIILPVLQETIQAQPFNPEQFFGNSQIKDVDKLLTEMRHEWDD